MTNLQKYDEVFVRVFGVAKDELAGIRYQSIDAWDSVGHADLIVAIEGTFGIMLDVEDVIEFYSYEKGKEILGKECYGIKFV